MAGERRQRNAASVDDERWGLTDNPYQESGEAKIMIGKVVVSGLLVVGIIVYFMPKSKPAKKIRRLIKQSPVTAAFR